MSAPAPASPGQITADGKTSFASLSAAYRITPSRIIWLMCHHRTGGLSKDETDYIDTGNWNSPMPSGMIIWLA